MPPTRCHDCPLRLSNGILHRPARPVSACRLGLRHAAAHARRRAAADVHRRTRRAPVGKRSGRAARGQPVRAARWLHGHRPARRSGAAHRQRHVRLHAKQRAQRGLQPHARGPCWPQAAPWPRRPAPRALPASAISAKPSASTPAAPRRRGRWPASGRLWIGWRSNRRIGRPGGCTPEAAGGLRARAGFLPLPRVGYPQVFPDLIARFAVFTGAAGGLPV